MVNLSSINGLQELLSAILSLIQARFAIFVSIVPTVPHIWVMVRFFVRIIVYGREKTLLVRQRFHGWASNFMTWLLSSIKTYFVRLMCRSSRASRFLIAAADLAGSNIARSAMFDALL